MMNKKLITSLIAVVLTQSLNVSAFAQTEKIRVGHFPNITHAPALVGKAIGHFEKAYGKNVSIEWKTFNAGPEAIEALFAGAIDILYVGPNPAINGYVRSKGEALRIIAGVASGGSAFVTRSEAGIQRFEDIKGKRVSTPQKGNTQDIALRYLMIQKGLASTEQGGDVEILNVSGGDQLTAFVKGQIDAVWTVEPWVSRLVAEANGKILFDEGELWPNGTYATTVLVVRKKFMDEHPELVQKWVTAHIEITNWLTNNFTKAKQIFNEELQRETGRPLPPSYLDHSFGRISFTYDPMKPQILESAKRAFAVGYLGRQEPDLKDLYELSFLNDTKTEIEMEKK